MCVYVYVHVHAYAYAYAYAYTYVYVCVCVYLEKYIGTDINIDIDNGYVCLAGTLKSR